MVCRVLLAGCFLAMLTMDALAQAVNVKVEGMSPGKLAKIGKSANMSTPGIKVIGKGSKVYLRADTTGSGATAVTSYTWSLASVPAGSTAALDSTDKGCSSFTPDIIGQYIVQASVNGGAKTDKETLFVSTYMGNSGPGSGLCATCHSANTAGWEATNHATLFTRAIVGQVEVNAYGFGTYGPSCLKCHTTGYDVSANNANYAYLAKQTGWDTTWYKGKTKSGTSYMIANGDSSIYTNMVTNYASVVPVANIGCESCHGPAKDHNGDKTKIARSLDAGVCLQCHDAPTHHMIGSEWSASDHATMPIAGSHATSTGCFPCHSGSAFVKWVDAGKPATMTTWSAAADGGFGMTCAVCHDAHNATNPNQLRTVDVDTLKNGYVVPAGIAGKGELCMNCHRSRYNANLRVTTKAPYFGFVDRWGPHGNPQADMFMGRNAYQYGDTSLTGLNTHLGLADGCVTCHMPAGNHELAMQDTTGGLHDRVDACRDCHGAGITKFDDIKATYDYDRNGKTEGVKTEVAGLLAKLKAKLPIDSLTGEPTLAWKDSAKIMNRPDLVQGIYTYTFVKNDLSSGMHNAKYAVSILQKALGFYPNGVKVIDQKTPSTFVLSQNYPNPFNPKTDIQFSIPRSATIQLNVYNILGELVATLASGDIVSGNYTVSWNGTNRQGTSVSSGIYFYRLAVSSNGAQEYTVTKKMLMTK
jgi:predicted CXXCH cytochrome family protein